jgi:hypothetical protein
MGDVARFDQHQAKPSVCSGLTRHQLIDAAIHWLVALGVVV